MNPQRRRLLANSTSSNTIGFKSAITMNFDDAPAVNVHGIRYCGSIEPENGDANSNGFWLVLCLPAEIMVGGDFPDDFAGLITEDFMPYVWGVGCFTASNQAPYHFEFTPSTSRTCQKGARILAYVVNTGISAGSVRVNTTLTCFTTT